MADPGTRIVGEDEQDREIDGVKVTQITIRWNATTGVSVYYRADRPDGVGVEMYADPGAACFDEPLDDQQLRELMIEYGVIDAAPTARPEA